MKQETRELLVWLANRLMMNHQYAKSWGPDFRLKELDESVETAIDDIKKYFDWADLKTPEDCSELGFRKWDQDSGIWLIPMWLFKAIPTGMKVYCIDGTTLYNHGQLDDDVRCGCVAYGIIPGYLEFENEQKPV